MVLECTMICVLYIVVVGDLFTKAIENTEGIVQKKYRKISYVHCKMMTVWCNLNMSRWYFRLSYICLRYGNDYSYPLCLPPWSQGNFRSQLPVSISGLSFGSCFEEQFWDDHSDWRPYLGSITIFNGVFCCSICCDGFDYILLLFENKVDFEKNVFFSQKMKFFQILLFRKE